MSTCVCAFCFQTLQGVRLGAKHPGMSGLAVVGAHRERTGQRCMRVVGMPSSRVRGSCYAVDAMCHALHRSKRESRI
jgi:hypothetical protein